jgi:protein-L-isoaspartate(D-aspartate) O-methyltransferase
MKVNENDLMKEVYENNKNYRGIKTIINAMSAVDRKYFTGNQSVYQDIPLQIGYGQTISQPTTVTRMISLLDLKKKHEVLEIGSGSGWNAAIIAYLIYPGRVTSIERIKPLYELAVSNFFKFAKAEKIKELRIDFIFADALDKKEEFWKVKYDRIIATAMVSDEMSENIKELGIKLLKDKGLLLFPYQEGMELWKKENKKLNRIKREEGYTFVPMLRGKK